jgi:hypothetical protein
VLCLLRHANFGESDTKGMTRGVVDVWQSVGRNLSLYIVLIGAAIGTGLFGAN